MNLRLKLIALCVLVLITSACNDKNEPVGPFFKLIEDGHIRDVKVAHFVTGFLLDSNRMGIYDRYNKTSHIISTDSSTASKFTNIACSWRNQRLITATTSEGLMVHNGEKFETAIETGIGSSKCGGGYHYALVHNNKIRLIKNWDTLSYNYVFEGDEEIQDICVGTRNIWISTKGRGLARIPHVVDGTLVRWKRDDDYRLFSDSIVDMQVYDTEKIWFLGKEKLFHFANREWAVYYLPDHIKPIDMAINTNNKPIIVTSDSLYHLEGINLVRYNLLDDFRTADMKFTCLDINHNGHLWIGTNNGLYIYQPEYH